jgi:5''-nucleotidase/2'',3''-cyclic phosphodiesterase and related esterases
MTGQQIKNVLEDALDFYLDPSGSWGAYPRASGLRFDVNEAMPKGSRVSNVEVNPKLAAAEWTSIDMSANYTVVTNNFIATPRDGYYEFGKIDAALKVDTYVEYAQSFIEYASVVENLNPVGADRASTQNWSDQLPDTLAPSRHVTKSPTASPIMTSVTSSPVATPSCTMDNTKKGKCKKTKKAKKSKDSKSPKSPKGRIRQ